MNEYVQKYLEKREAQRKEELKKQALKIMNKLKIGEKEYPEGSDPDLVEYPYWDLDKGKRYRYNAGELSEEEIKLILQDHADESKLVEKAERSGWYTFATVMMVIGGLGVLITLFIAASDSYHPNWTPFFVALISFMFELGFWATVQLLAGIKQGIDNLQNKL